MDKLLLRKSCGCAVYRNGINLCIRHQQPGALIPTNDIGKWIDARNWTIGENADLNLGRQLMDGNLEFFEEVLKNRLYLIKKVLALKGKEYTRGSDRFINFKTSGKRLGVTPERALNHMRDKHETSIMDIIDDLDKGVLPSVSLLEEKIGDSINYLILLEGLVKERIKNG